MGVCFSLSECDSLFLPVLYSLIPRFIFPFKYGRRVALDCASIALKYRKSSYMIFSKVQRSVRRTNVVYKSCSLSDENHIINEPLQLI